MAAVITLSDSDDSDDLPCFADRVKRLLESETTEEKRNNSPPKNVSQFHSISDSDDSDSRETIPLTKDRSPSPVPSILKPVKYDSNHRVDCVSLSNDACDLDCKPASPVFSLPDLDYHSESPPWNLTERPNYFTNLQDENMSSDDDICITNSKSHKVKRSDKEEEKEQKKKMRLEKKKEKELMKALKASEKEILKQQKPEECLKTMKIVVDHNILLLNESQSFFNSLDQHNLNYSVEENNCKYSINWYRKVINITTENHELVREEREELEDTLILIIPNEDFLKMVHAYVQNSKGKSCGNLSLEEYVVSVKALYPDCKITCITVGFQKYMRNVKEEGSFDIKTIAKQIHKNASEEAVIGLQLQSSINFNFLDSMSELGSLLHHFTKAIADAPRRKEKESQKSSAFSWYADVDSHCPIKLSKEGSSFIKLWRQQIQQFQNVGPEVAEAIVSRYSSPRSLLKAYKKCLTTKDAENLLQDIVVRRNYGPLGTQKRIGPELSYKLHLFFTSRDGNKLLKR